MKELTITTSHFSDNFDRDKKAYEALSDNGKKAYNFFEQLGQISPMKTWTLDLSECGIRSALSVDDFIAAVKELESQHYFMYYISKERKYVFANTRMVY